MPANAGPPKAVSRPAASVTEVTRDVWLQRTDRLSDRRLYALPDAGLLIRLGRGLCQRVEASGEADPGLVEIAHRAPWATLCLTTALARQA